jgi:hypothetical protein
VATGERRAHGGGGVIARYVPPLQGARWLAEGWRMFRAAPLGWFALVFAYWLAMTVLSIVPYVGVLVASIVVPAFSVGFMAASRAASRGQPVELAMLFAGFRERLPAQLALGAAYLVSLALVIGGSALVDDGMLARWLITGRGPAQDEAADEGLLGALAAAAALYAPVMAMFWFAPLLVAWHGMAPAKALFYSFFASLMNWRAFLAYGAAVAVVMFLMPTVLLLVLVFASGGALRLQPMALVLPLALVMLPTLFASFYASYRDVFGGADAQEGG